MLSETAAATTPPTSPREPIREKVRLRFRKSADLRLLSHHDLMRTFERMLRRAQIPFGTTEGFNPKPRMVFALSLPLGIVGCEEVAELELSEPIPADVLLDRLRAATVPGLDILSVRRLDNFRKSARPHRATYRIPLPPDREIGLSERIGELLSQAELWIERTRPERKRINVRPMIDQIRIVPGAIELDLWTKPSGIARPNEVLDLLGLQEILEAGAVIERTRLELEDEIPPSDRVPEPVPDSSLPEVGGESDSGDAVTTDC
jgi:radical SAM-linked protein